MDRLVAGRGSEPASRDRLGRHVVTIPPVAGQVVVPNSSRWWATRPDRRSWVVATLSGAASAKRLPLTADTCLTAAGRRHRGGVGTEITTAHAPGLAPIGALDADYHSRDCVLVQLNRGEGRHGLARDVCHGRRGELRQPYREGQEEQLNALGLIVNTIVLYNTIYTQRAIDHIAASTGSEPRDEDVEPQPPRQRPHHPHRPLPRPAPGTATRPRRVPRSQHPGRRRSCLTRSSERNFPPPHRKRLVQALGHLGDAQA
jgi:hypothetical protein